VDRIVLAALLFSPLAGVTAFLITFEEHSRHRLSRRETLTHALRAAAVAVVAFAVLALALGVLLPRLVAGPV
jgi:hypothetical protein